MKKAKYFYFLALLISVVLFSNCATPVKVEGTAMLPNFKDGDRLLMNNSVEELQRGDVIYFKYPKDLTKAYIKRIIGLPNETVEIRNGEILVNGQILAESYVDQIYNQSKNNFSIETIPDQNYFVLGDNRDNSSDSRSWGTVHKDLILGKYYSTYSSSEKK